MSNKNIIYLCNFIDDSIKKERNITTDSQAASNKVMSLCRAMQSAGADVSVLSLGRGRQRGSWSKYARCTCNISGVSVLYAAFIDAPIITHLASAFSVLSIFFRSVRRRKVVLVVYNRCWHYVPTLFAARFFRVPSYLDLEDGFIDKPGFFLTWLVQFFDWACPQGALLACEALREQVKTKKTMVCYGVANNMKYYSKNWHTDRLNVLWGGVLSEQTGGVLFMQSVKLLTRKFPYLQEEIHFFVTGRGSMAKIIKTFASQEGAGWVTFHGNMPAKDFSCLRDRSHIGLSLNLSLSGLDRTVFPSKTIEMSARGLLLVSTKTSDISRVFSNQNALLLQEETTEALVASLVWAVTHREEASVMAQRNRVAITERYSPSSVGEDLMQFVEVCHAVK